MNTNNIPNQNQNSTSDVNNVSQVPSTDFSRMNAGYPPAFAPMIPAKNVYDNIDRVFVVLAFILGFFYIKVSNPHDLPLGSVFFVASAVIWIFAYGIVRHVKWSLRDILLPIYAIVISFTFILSSPGLHWAVSYMLVVFVIAYWAMCLFGGSDERYPSGLSFFEGMRAVVIMPFTKFGSVFPAVFHSGNKKKNRGPIVLYVILGLFAALIPTVIVINLLKFDNSFEAAIDKLSDLFSFRIIWENIGTLILAIPVAMYLFGLLYSSFVKRYKPVVTRRSLDTALSKMKIAPVSFSVAALTPLLIIYIIFFASQFKYYVSAFTGVLPEGITYSDYARDGFFQLVAVAVLNLIIISLTSVFMCKIKPVQRAVSKIYISVYCVFTLILIATALSKMYLYVDVYGLTPKRVWSSWLMILLAVVFILVLIRQIFYKMKLSPAVITVCALMFALISLTDVTAFCADYNAERYLSDKTEYIPYTFFEESSSQIPAVMKMLEAYEDGVIEGKGFNIKRAEHIIEVYENEVSSAEGNKGFLSWNLPDYKAEKALNE